jgi:hypothetical protein
MVPRSVHARRPAASVDVVSAVAPKRAPKCSCRCGQAPAETTRLRKASCPCGASIIRLSRSALSIVHATCGQCGDPLAPDCLFDRTCSHDERDASEAVAVLEQRYDDALRRAAPKMGRKDPPKFRCGDCQAVRAAKGPCAHCRSERPPTTSYMHPRAARAAGGDMPF